MAAGAQVCRYRDERACSTPISFARPSSASGFLRNFTQVQQPLYWRVSSYPPTRTSFEHFEVAALKKPTVSGADCESRLPVCLPRPNKYVCRYIFGCPLTLQPNGLRSCGTVQVHLNNVLVCGLQQHFSSLNLTHSINLQKVKAATESEMCKLTSCRGQDSPKDSRKEGKEVPEVSPVKESAHPKKPPTSGVEQRTTTGNPCHLSEVADEMAGNAKLIHTPAQQVLPVSDITSQKASTSVEDDGDPSDCEFPDSDNESEVEGDEYGYETDTDEEEGEEEDDFVEFSDECPNSNHASLTVQPCEASSTLTPNDRSYSSLYSEESGYCENGSSDSRESLSEDEESDAEDVPLDDTSCRDLWNSFVAEALSRSPQLKHEKKQERVEHRKAEKTVKSSKPVGRTHNKHECSEPLPTCPLTPPSSRRVSFKPDSELCVVHHMFTWNYAYRSCRKGPWEQYARDRQHFRRRIDSVACVLRPCLEKKLRCCSGGL